MVDWTKELDASKKFREASLEHGRKVYARYEDRREDQTMFGGVSRRANIFYSNVCTIKESLFNSLPKPDVNRLHKGAYEDDVSRVAALIVSRGLEYEIRCAPSFTEAVRAAILDRLVPGTGQLWVRFGADEQIFVDVVFWEDFIYSPARTWSEVSWVGRKLHFTPEEYAKAYPDQKPEEGTENTSLSTTSTGAVTPAQQQINKGKICVLEIWDKRDRKIYHVLYTSKKVIKELEDPYQLRDFFPCPCPLIASPPTTVFLPITDYHIAQDQYMQLDVIYARMALIIEAIKVTGVYDASSPELGRMLQGQENKLIPVDNWAMFAEKGGVKGAIDWYPVETVATVLKELQGQFEAIKAILYEVTGMSDIVRGASNQYETASAQQIKAQFAGVRLNGYQRCVAEFVRDTVRIMAELMTQLYSPEKLMKIVGPLEPADEQYVEPALQTLGDDLLAHYSVDIQADSLTQADWALEKEQRSELVMQVSQFIQAGLQTVQQDPNYGELFFGMLKFAVAGYKGGAELEGILDQYIETSRQQAQEMAENPPEQPPDPDQMKMQMEQQKMEAEMAMEQQRFQMEQQKSQQEAMLAQQEGQARLQLEQAQAQADLQVQQQKAQLEAQLQQMEIQHKEKLFALEMQMKMQEKQMKMQEKQMDMQIGLVERDQDQKERTEDREMDVQERKEDREEDRKDREEGAEE